MYIFLNKLTVILKIYIFIIFIYNCLYKTKQTVNKMLYYYRNLLVY